MVTHCIIEGRKNRDRAIKSFMNQIMIKEKVRVVFNKGMVKIKSANLHAVFLQALAELPSLFSNEF